MRSLSESGVDVGVCVLGRESNVHPWQWLPAECRFLNLPGDYRKPWQTARMVSAVSAVIREQQPDLLHSWLWLSDFITARANPTGHVPHLSHIVDRRTWQESNQFRHRLRRWLTRQAFERSRTRFLAVSHAARQFAIDTLGLDAERVEVAWNSIEVEEFADVPPSAYFAGERDELILGMASRLEPEKGHLVLLEALAEFRSRGGRARLLITGRGEYQKELQRHIERLQLADHVEFVGFVESVKQFLAEIDLFLVPSVDSEGLPTTILEAMAAGRPVIATDVGGATEAIRHQVDGLIVPAGDPGAISVAIEDLVNNSNAVGALCKSARKRMQDCFSMSSMLQTVLEHYMLLSKQDLAKELCL